MSKILIHLAHPAHYHLFKNIIRMLKRGHEVHVSYNDKDVLRDLVENSKLEVSWHDLATGESTRSKYSFIWHFIQKEYQFFKLARRLRPGVLVGTPIIVAHSGFLLSIPSVIVNEDDFKVVSGSTRIGYPFADKILAPESCNHWKWGGKTVHYDGYHELAYLHPKYFTADKSIASRYVDVERPYVVVRLSALMAHHDVGKRGISDELIKQLRDCIGDNVKMIINSEKSALPDKWQEHAVSVHPSHMHHVLHYASLYIGDSQTMAAEAAVLGTPSVRYNDFVGRLGYLNELEVRYGLTVGINMGEETLLLDTVKTILREVNREEWRERASRMIAEKVDVVDFISKEIEKSIGNT